MRTCKYCEINTSSKEDFCPGCGAPLPLSPPPVSTEKPRETMPTTVNYTWTPPSTNKKSAAPTIIIVGLSLVFTILFIFWIGMGSLPFSDKTDKGTISEYAALNSEANTPALTLNEKFTNPVLRQSLEKYFGNEFPNITQEEIDTIQFIYIQSESISIGTKPSYEELSYLPWNHSDISAMFNTTTDHTKRTNLLHFLTDTDSQTDPTTITFEGRFNDASCFEYFTGLKTLIIGTSTIYPESLPPMPQLEHLVVNSMYETEDFTIFAKFPNLVELIVAGSDLIRMDGISEMTHLQKLGLHRTGLTNLGLLSEMKNIESITLIDNDALPDIQTLSAMTWLKELHIENVPYTDLHAIANMTQLERLTISNTNVKSIGFLSGLTQLKYLYLHRNNNLINLPSLSACSRLEELYLSCDKFEDLSGLDGLASVTKATLLAPNTVSFLPSFTALRHLELQLGGAFQDISPLASLVDLSYLKMYGRSYVEIDGIASLSNLIGLKELDLSSSEGYFNYDFIFALVGLERLNLANNNIFSSDFSRFSNLTNLQILYLDRVRFYSGYTMQGSGGIYRTYHHDEQAFDQISATLADLPNLQLLSASSNGFSDLHFTRDMNQLLVFNASDNYITDVSPIAGLTQLKYLNLAENAVENPKELDSLINAQISR